MPPGNGGCEAVGQGVTTERESGVSGGRSCAEEEVADRPERSLRR